MTTEISVPLGPLLVRVPALQCNGQQQIVHVQKAVSLFNSLFANGKLFGTPW